MKEYKKLTLRRRQRFMLQFQRYLESYLKHPGFRKRDTQSGQKE